MSIQNKIQVRKVIVDRDGDSVNRHMYLRYKTMLFILFFFHFFVCVSCLVMPSSLQPCGLQLARLLCPWNSPGKSTGVGCQFPLHKIFPTQGSNPGLPHCRKILYHLRHQGRPPFMSLVFFILYICLSIYLSIYLVVPKLF